MLLAAGSSEQARSSGAETLLCGATALPAAGAAQPGLEGLFSRGHSSPALSVSLHLHIWAADGFKVSSLSPCCWEQRGEEGVNVTCWQLVLFYLPFLWLPSSPRSLGCNLSPASRQKLRPLASHPCFVYLPLHSSPLDSPAGPCLDVQNGF